MNWSSSNYVAVGSRAPVASCSPIVNTPSMTKIVWPIRKPSIFPTSLFTEVDYSHIPMRWSSPQDGFPMRCFLPEGGLVGGGTLRSTSYAWRHGVQVPPWRWLAIAWWIFFQQGLAASPSEIWRTMMRWISFFLGDANCFTTRYTWLANWFSTTFRWAYVNSVWWQSCTPLSRWFRTVPSSGLRLAFPKLADHWRIWLVVSSFAHRQLTFQPLITKCCTMYRYWK